MVVDEPSTLLLDPARIAAVHGYARFAEEVRPALDELVALLARLCAVPMVFVNLVDGKRQRSLSAFGLPPIDTPLEGSFCGTALLDRSTDVFEVPDAREDPRFCASPWVLGDPFIRFYAAASLRSAGGLAVGTLCIADRVPRRLPAPAKEDLLAIARQVMGIIELAHTRLWLEQVVDSIEDGLFGLDPEGRVGFANAGACAVLGRDAFVGRPISEACGPEFAEAVLALPDGGSAEIERGGSWYHVRSYLNEVGRVVHARDVTASRAHFERLRLFEACVRQINDMIMITEAEPLDEPGPRIVFVNPAFERRTGWSKEEILGRSPRVLQGPDSDRRALDRVRAALARRTTVCETLVNYSKDGEPFWVELDVAPLLSPNGDCTHFIGVERDVTDRVVAAEALQASEARFRILSAVTSDAVWEWDIEHDELRWYSGYERMSGMPAQSAAAGVASWETLLHPDDRDRVLGTLRAALEGSSATWSAEYRLLSIDGRVLFILDRARILRNGSGRATGMVGGMTDLTESRLAEIRIRQQAALLDKAQDAIWVRDRNHRITFWNGGAQRLFGWEAAQIIGRSALELYPDPDPFFAANEVLERRGEWMGELEHRCRDGQRRLVQGRWTLLDDVENPGSVLVIDTDVTEQRALEAQFLRVQRLETFGALAGGIAHDLNNALAPILLCLEPLLEGDRDPEEQEDLRTIELAARRAADMVRQLLGFARGSEGPRTRVDPAAVLRDVERLVRDTFPKGVSLAFSVERALPPVEADPTQLHQLLLNLCVNGRDAMPSGGRLEVRADSVTIDEPLARSKGLSPGNYLRLVVSDTGLGIPKSQQLLIFEPFFTTKPSGQGTGLGLSTALAIARGHGGHIEVHSEPGRGSRFEVLIAASAAGVVPSPSESGEDGGQEGAGEIILVVDDEPAVRAQVRRTLERAGYRVALAADGPQALALHRRLGPEVAVLVTDVAMPGLDGPATAAALRALAPGLPLVLMSGLAGVVDLDRFDPPPAAVLDKPFGSAALLRAVARALDPGR